MSSTSFILFSIILLSITHAFKTLFVIIQKLRYFVISLQVKHFYKKKNNQFVFDVEHNQGN